RRAPGRKGLGLAEVGRARDVEMDPWPGDELAEEQGALDEAALGRRRVGELGVPALHVGPVLVDEGQLPEALTRLVRGDEDVVHERLRRPERARHELAERP